MLRPAAALIGTAVHDSLRLVGSTNPKRDRLCAELMCAMTALAPEASACFMSIAGPQTPMPLPKLPTRSTQPDGYDLTCRSVLRVVRHAVDGLPGRPARGPGRARNHLFATVAATGLVTYAFLGIAFLLEVPVSAVVAFTAFYLTGAVVGLFRQLQAASVRDTIAEDDFGLSYARLLHAPLFAGLAGVGGVVLTAFASELTVATGNPKAAVPTLGQIFDLSVNQGGLLFAAVFGLTPTLLITRLQSRAESYKADLKSSEPAEQSPSQLATR